MKKLNKKGFTITELVIVISVIAILSAVLIPTFSGLVKKAKESAAMQEADAALTVVLAEEDAQLDADKTYYFFSGDYCYKYNDGKLEKVTGASIPVKNAGSDDVVYTKDDDDLKGINVMVDNPETAEVEKATTVTELEDLGNVVVWAKKN